MSRELRLVTRASRLALIQTEEFIQQFDGLSFSVTTLESFGDKHKDIPLDGGSTPDFFTRELDQLLLDGKADLAVHSAKDVPYPLPAGLRIAALTRAAEKSDALVSAGGAGLAALPPGAVVGTSSRQRKEQILEHRPDLTVADIRGTIEERVAQVDDGSFDAAVIATCALQRLDLDHRISELLPFRTHPLQGNLAVVIKDTRDDLAALFAPVDIRAAFGTVSLAGGGPGDPELMTLKTRRLLDSADVILYDALVNRAVLSGTPGKKIYVGKRKGKRQLSQDGINRLLYRYARRGLMTVRLKGGDPFVFGRGGEEYAYLAERLVPVEIIPGITAAQGAAAYSGIPLTQRRTASSVAVCTGFPVEGITVPTADTLVYYMGASSKDRIIQKVLDAGRPPETPVAFITNASLPAHTQRVTTLQQEADAPQPVASPLIIIIGPVAALNGGTAWFTRKRKILVTGSNPEPFRLMGEVVHQPAIALEPVSVTDEIKSVLENLDRFGWLLFTSRFGVTLFMDAVLGSGRDIRALAGCRIASIGHTTSAALSRYGLCPDLVTVPETSEQLIEAFRDIAPDTGPVLIPRSDLAADRLVEGLRSAGHRVTPLVVYRNVPVPYDSNDDLNAYDTIAFASPSGVRRFKQRYPQLPAGIQCLVTGPVTAAAVQKEYGHEKISTIQN